MSDDLRVRFEALFARSSTWLLGLARKSVGSGWRCKCEGEDVLQDVAVRMLGAIARGSTGFLADEDQFLAYAARVVQTVVHDKLAGQERACRDRGREQPLYEEGSRSDELRTPSTLSPSRACARAESEERVREAVQALPPVDRELVQGRTVAGESFAELGDRLSMSGDGARKRFLRACASLVSRCRSLVDSVVTMPRRGGSA